MNHVAAKEACESSATIPSEKPKEAAQITRSVSLDKVNEQNKVIEDRHERGNDGETHRHNTQLRQLTNSLALHTLPLPDFRSSQNPFEALFS